MALWIDGRRFGGVAIGASVSALYLNGHRIWQAVSLRWRGRDRWKGRERW